MVPGRVAAELCWDQALTWRMGRQWLIERAPASRWVSVVADLGGVHAQLMSSAVSAIAARVNGLGTGSVAGALWSDRSLVKLWAMRGTLHLLPASDHLSWTTALAQTYPAAYRHYRMADPEALELAAVIGELLRGRILTRTELADELGRTRQLRPELIERMTSSWGSGLKPASFLGLLCYGPPLNGESRFTNPQTWLTKSRQSGDNGFKSLQDVGRRYFRSYAPATIRDLAAWWGTPQRSAMPIMESIRSELATVQINNDRYQVLRDDVDTMLAAAPPSADEPVVRLLPGFDPWVVGGNRSTKPGIGNPTLDPAYRSAVYRLQGWVSAVITVNGQIAGTWTRKGQEITLAPFQTLPRPARAALTKEVARLTDTASA